MMVHKMEKEEIRDRYCHVEEAGSGETYFEGLIADLAYKHNINKINNQIRYYICQHLDSTRRTPVFQSLCCYVSNRWCPSDPSVPWSRK